MKSTLFILTLVASSAVAMSQKGNWYVGGVAGFTSSTFKVSTP